MAYRIVLFVLLNVLLAQCENNELCSCDSEPKEEAALWDFLKQLSVEVPEDERDAFTVSAGQLSPLVDCDCENNRKKRKAVDEPEAPKVLAEPEAPELEEEETKRPYKRNGCPQRYVKVGFLCVHEEDLE